MIQKKKSLFFLFVSLVSRLDLIAIEQPGALSLLPRKKVVKRRCQTLTNLEALEANNGIWI